MIPVWEQHLILRVKAGSQAYGLDTPESDLDTRGICMPPKEALLGLTPFEQHQDETGDNVVFSLQKFVRLALEGNPNLIETLFTEDILFINNFGERLLEQRQRFLSRRVAERFGHYALQQLKRMENHHRWWANPPQQPDPRDYGAVTSSSGAYRFPDAQRKLAFERDGKVWSHYERWRRERNPKRAALEQKFGYDTKHAMHLCRLLKMGQEIVSRGEVLVRRPDAPWLRQVREGLFNYQELLQWAQSQEMQLRELRERSPLPEQPDQLAIERLLIEWIEDYHWPGRSQRP
jgi:hypothetical protein